MKSSFFTALFLTFPLATHAAPIIRCDSRAAKPITIELNAEYKFGKPLNCIYANGSIPSEGEPCAPTNEFGLDAPTGSGELVGTVSRWQDYLGHVGPVYGSAVTHTTIGFNGGFMGSGVLTGEWRFVVDRVRGSGNLYIQKKNGWFAQPLRFACRAASRKF